MYTMLTRLINITVLLLLLLPGPASAQIVNTLRGFQAGELLWSGGLEGSVESAGGNEDYLQFQFDAAVQYATERNRWRLLGSASQRRTDGDVDAEEQLGHLRHNYRFTDRLASIAFTQWAHSPFRRLETRMLFGVGGRVDFVQKENVEAAVGAAYMYEREDVAQLPADAPAGTVDDSGVERNDRLSLFTSIVTGSVQRVQSDVVAFWQPLASDLGDWRLFVTANLRVKVAGGLYFLFRYHLMEDSDPPATVLKRDWKIRSGVGFEF